MRLNYSNSNSVLSRGGVASLEFVMFIPVLVGFMVVTLWVVRVQDAKLRAGIQAEVATAERTVIMFEHSQLAQSESMASLNVPELTQLVHGFSPGLPIGAGMVREKGQFDSGAGVADIIPSAGTVEDAQMILAHAWESQVFEFPQEASDQPELTLPDSVRGVAAGFTGQDVFKSLLSFSGSSGNGGSLAKAQQELSESLAEIDARIQNTRKEIRNLETKIAQLQSQTPVDEEQVDKLKRQLANKKSDERRLLRIRATVRNVNSAA